MNATDSTGRTALMRAAHAGHLPIVRMLLDEGANVNATDTDGRTALMWAHANQMLTQTAVVDMLTTRALQEQSRMRALSRMRDTLARHAERSEERPHLPARRSTV